jgi:hypothetical protein
VTDAEKGEVKREREKVSASMYVCEQKIVLTVLQSSNVRIAGVVLLLADVKMHLRFRKQRLIATLLNPPK